MNRRGFRKGSCREAARVPMRLLRDNRGTASGAVICIVCGLRCAAARRGLFVGKGESAARCGGTDMCLLSGNTVPAEAEWICRACCRGMRRRKLRGCCQGMRRRRPRGCRQEASGPEEMLCRRWSILCMRQFLQDGLPKYIIGTEQPENVRLVWQPDHGRRRIKNFCSKNNRKTIDKGKRIVYDREHNRNRCLLSACLILYSDRCCRRVRIINGKE